MQVWTRPGRDLRSATRERHTRSGAGIASVRDTLNLRFGRTLKREMAASERRWRSVVRL
jgi:hypothetical protein